MANESAKTPPLQGRGKGWGISKDRLQILHERAKKMRLNPTEPEKLLWRYLSRSQLAGCKFRRHAVIGDSIADFSCPSHSLIVELDGDTHVKARDDLRDQRLAKYGYRTLRFRNRDVMKNLSGVLEQIKNALTDAAVQDAPHPNPSPEEEGLRATEALRDAARRLAQISDTPRLDAELLLAHALGISRDQLLLDLPILKAPGSFDALIARRTKSEPVAHLTGIREFWGLELMVTADVLIPRPDSELLIEQAVARFAKNPPSKILDLGTGSGALFLAVLSEFADAKGVGIDASEKALAIADKNAERLELKDRVHFELLDWTKADWTSSLSGPFDCILVNPPYVSTAAKLAPDVADYEPHQALFAGEDGLDDYKILIPALDALLAPSGVALLEIGFDQRQSVSNIAENNGYVVESKQDLGGNDRLLILTR